MSIILRKSASICGLLVALLALTANPEEAAPAIGSPVVHSLIQEVEAQRKKMSVKTNQTNATNSEQKSVELQ
jgi:hypothetical protein